MGRREGVWECGGERGSVREMVCVGVWEWEWEGERVYGRVSVGGCVRVWEGVCGCVGVGRGESVWESEYGRVCESVGGCGRVWECRQESV